MAKIPLAVTSLPDPDEATVIVPPDSEEEKGATERTSPSSAVANAGISTREITQAIAARGLPLVHSADGADASPSAHVDLTSILIPSSGDKYHIGNVVAKGGVGAILDARDLNCRRHVAMKILMKGQVAGEDEVLRFIDEAQVTAQLEHPNIVPVHELALDHAGNPYYTMKLIQGISLKEILERLRQKDPEISRAYSLNRLLNIFLKICDAVAFAHSRHIVHRDLKPANIMIGGYGEVLVLDWGLAKQILPAKEGNTDGGTPVTEPVVEIDSLRLDAGADILQTLTGTILGTPAFMSPEQARGDIEHIDQRTDIYTLGGILYNILTLQPPINKRHNLRNAVMAISRGEVAEQLDFTGSVPHCPQQQVPEALAAVARKALSASQEDRYQTVKALQAEIEAYQGNYATTAEQASLLRQFLLLIKRHREVTALLAFGIVLLFVLGIMFMLRINTEKERALQAKQEAQESRDAAEKALANLASLSKKAAPRFLIQAQRLVDQSRWNAAREAVDFAVGLNPNLRKAWFLKARIHLAVQEFDQASQAFQHCAKLDKRGLSKIAAQYAALSQKGELTPAQQNTLAQAVEQAGDAAVAAYLFRDFNKSLEGLKAQIEAARRALIKDNPAAGNLHFNATVTTQSLSLDLARNPELRDISSLAPLHLTMLDLQRTHVSDLSPLKGMPLTDLSLREVAVRDLSPLAGMPLKKLNLRATAATDLSPLAGMPLENLNLQDMKIDDISPLHGLPLIHLNLWGTRVLDLSPLKGAKLKTLNLWGTNVQDLTPLRGMPLQILYLGDTRVSDITVLAGMPLNVLYLGNTRVSDLAPLKGSKLEKLEIRGTRVVDLTPLKGIPLRSLDLSGTRIKDLTPLAGMPLKTLFLCFSVVSDLTPLAGLPLRELYLNGSRKIKDISTLETCPSLEILRLPDQPLDLAPLRKLPHLKRINGLKAKAFWKQYAESE